MSTGGPVDARLYAPAALRNRAALAALARDLLPKGGRLLEIASGTGEHITDWAGAAPAARFHPSDIDPEARASCVAWTAALGRANVAPPLDLDAGDPRWWRLAPRAVDVVFAVNLLHVAPLKVLSGLMGGATEVLSPEGVLTIVGPLRDDATPDPATEALDENLRARDPAWGVRHFGEIEAAAALAGLALRIAERLRVDGGPALHALSFRRR